jgi:3'(2'), 5'-bisphosphate nucleotidase
MNPMLGVFQDAALAAGQAILGVRDAGAAVAYKADRSPVTEADEQAERIILDRLRQFYPDIPIVAEEAASAGHVPATDDKPFFLVDPLDGTREFIGGHDDFTVNIALIEGGSPTLGFIYAPALGVAYGGGGGEAYKLLVGPDFSVGERLPIRACTSREPPVAVASRSHRTAETDAYLDKAHLGDVRSIGSSLKFCLLAEGAADLYPRFGRTMQWDTAAGDAILRAAGGLTTDPQGRPLRYGRIEQLGEHPFVNSDFIAHGAGAKPV